MIFKVGQHYQQVVTDVGEEHLHAPLERDLLHGGERVQSGRSRRHPSSSSRQGFFSAVKVFFTPVKVSEALGDKLYMSPALETASWCNESGYVVHLYLHPTLVS